MKDVEFRHSWIIPLPYAILVDKRLSSTAKLIAAEIFALISFERGYCSANNKHFAEVLRCTKRSVQQSLQQLKNFGYIKVEVENEKGGMRKIYPGELFVRLKDSFKKPATPHEKNFIAPRKKSAHPQTPYKDKNDIKNDNIIIPPKSPLKGKRGDYEVAAKTTGKGAHRGSQNGEVETLLEEIAAQFPQSPLYFPLYRKAINDLGVQQVWCKFREALSGVRENRVEDGGRYLTTLLKDMID